MHRQAVVANTRRQPAAPMSRTAAPGRCWHARATSSSRTPAAVSTRSSKAKQATAQTAAAVEAAAAPGGVSSSWPRRQLLGAAAAAAAVAAGVALPPPLPAAASAVASGDWSSPGLAAPEDDSLPKFFTAPGGVKVQELLVGKGAAQVQPGSGVLVDYVLRRANGYFIYGTLEGTSFQPRDMPIGPIRLQLGSGEVIEGLEAALVGMRPGGKRRILVPPESGYTSNVLQPQMPTFATKRQLANHSSEPLLFEVELLRVL